MYLYLRSNKAIILAFSTIAAFWVDELCQAGWWNIKLKRTKSRGFVPLLLYVRGHETAPETKEIAPTLQLIYYW